MSTNYTASRLYTGLDETLITPGAVTVTDQTISYAGSLANAPGSGEYVELGDVTLLPGLIDTHVHLTFSASERVLEDYFNDSDALKIIHAPAIPVEAAHSWTANRKPPASVCCRCQIYLR